MCFDILLLNSCYTCKCTDHLIFCIVMYFVYCLFNTVHNTHICSIEYSEGKYGKITCIFSSIFTASTSDDGLNKD